MTVQEQIEQLKEERMPYEKKINELTKKIRTLQDTLSPYAVGDVVQWSTKRRNWKNHTEKEAICKARVTRVISHRSWRVVRILAGGKDSAYETTIYDWYSNLKKVEVR